MKPSADLARLKRMPEFAALQQVCAALLPLDPEGRRKVVEAAHSLMKISAGTPAARQTGGDKKRPRRR